VQLTFNGTCTSAAADPGVQLVSVEVRSTGSRPTTERVQFVKRRIEPTP
jgi:hypothetical protein